MAIYKGSDLSPLMDEPLTAEIRRHYHAVDITESIWNRMQELGINQTQLAEQLGKSCSTVSRMLSAQGNMTLQTISELEQALGITLIDTTPYESNMTVHLKAPHAGKQATWPLPPQAALQHRRRQDGRLGTSSMSKNVFSPLTIDSLYVVASDFSISETPAEEMEVTLDFSLKDEKARYDRGSNAHFLEQTLSVTVRMTDDDDPPDERMRASSTVYISTECIASEDAPGLDEYMRQSSLSIAYGHARSCIASMTALSPMGSYMIPAIDPKALLENLRGEL